MYRRCGERKILTSESLREAANTDLDLGLPKIQKSDPNIEIALALGDGEGRRGARRVV
jgi:hypothetical protein